MSMFYGYFDESGQDNEPIVVVSGFISTWDKWRQLGDEWEHLLRKHGLSEFKFTHAKHDADKVREFIDVIKPTIETGLTIAVDTSAFNALPDGLKTELGGSAYYMAFKSLVLHLLNYLHAGDPRNTLNITNDEHQQFSVHCLEWYLTLKASDPRARQHLSGFGVADSRHYPQIQAADLLAGAFRAEARLIATQTEYWFRPLFKDLVSQEHSSVTQMRLRILERDDMNGLSAEWKRESESLGV